MTDQVRAYIDAGADELIIPDWNLGTATQAADTLERFFEIAVRTGAAPATGPP